MSVCVCICVNVHVQVQVPTVAEENVGALGFGMACICEPFDLCAGI